MKFKKLSELLIDRQLVLVLGAGASRDYLLPLWCDLKKDMIERISGNLDDLRISNETAKFWKSEFEKASPETTLDSLAGKSDVDSQYFAFQKLVAHCLIQGEAISETISHSWIESFADEIVKLLREAVSLEDQSLFEMRLNALKSMKVISLNYDRVFLQRFLLRLKENLKTPLLGRRAKRLGRWTTETDISYEVIYPHGCIGKLNQGGSTASLKPQGQLFKISAINPTATYSSYTPYGDVSQVIGFGKLDNFLTRCASKPDDDDIGLNIVSVDDLHFNGALSPSYTRALELIENSNLISIGLSKDGFNQSKLNFKNSQTVTLTNSEKEILEFDSERLPQSNNLFFEQRGIHAVPFIKKISS